MKVETVNHPLTVAHHKGCREKLEEAREGKAMLKKAEIEDRQIVPKKCLEI